MHYVDGLAQELSQISPDSSLQDEHDALWREVTHSMGFLAARRHLGSWCMHHAKLWQRMQQELEHVGRTGDFFSHNRALSNVGVKVRFETMYTVLSYSFSKPSMDNCLLAHQHTTLLASRVEPATPTCSSARCWTCVQPYCTTI